MIKKTQERLSSSSISRDVNSSELREIAEILKKIKDNTAQKLYIHLVSFNYDPFIFSDWCDEVKEEYNYKALFFCPIDQIPLVIGVFEELDEVEQEIIRYRLSHSK